MGTIFDRSIQVFIAGCAAIGTYVAIFGVPKRWSPMWLQGPLMTPWWAWALIAIGALFFGLQVLRANSKRRHAPKPITEQQAATQPNPQTINPLESVFSKKMIRLVDFIYDGKYEISDKTFEDCVLFGPAIITLLGTGILANSEISGDKSSTFIECAPDRRLVGVIGIRNCTIRRCRLVGIGITGTKDDLDKIRGGISDAKKI